MFRNPVVLRTVATSALAWTGASLVACLAAFFVAGLPGLGSAAVAAGAGLVFPILTVIAIAVPDRGYGSAPYAARVFFGFLVGFVLKVALFFVALLILLDVSRPRSSRSRSTCSSRTGSAAPPTSAWPGSLPKLGPLLSLRRIFRAASAMSGDHSGPLTRFE